MRLVVKKGFALQQLKNKEARHFIHVGRALAVEYYNAFVQSIF